jgi:hypothetical protein
MVDVVCKVLVKKFQYYYFWLFFQSSVPVKQKTRYNNTLNMSHMLYIFLVTMNFYFNPLQMKCRLLYLKAQSVPHSKHFLSRL